MGDIQFPVPLIPAYGTTPTRWDLNVPRGPFPTVDIPDFTTPALNFDPDAAYYLNTPVALWSGRDVATPISSSSTSALKKYWPLALIGVGALIFASGS